MVGTSDRIIILTAVVLVIIILLPNSGLMRPLGTVFDIEVEIATSRDFYEIGESFTATLQLVNNGSKDVWMNPIYELPFLGNSVNDPEPDTEVIHLDWIQGAMIHIPPKSKFKLFERDFESQYSGEFIISNFGVNKSVLIINQDSTWVSAKVINVELSSEHKKVELSSDDLNVPPSLYEAIDRALMQETSTEIEVIPEGHQRMFKISNIDAESIIHYLGGEIEMDRLSYEFYLSHANTTYSILIQFFHPLVTS